MAGIRYAGGFTWQDLVVASLTEGLDGWCVHEPLMEHSERSRTLLDRIRATGRWIGSVPLPAADLVHLDLHAENVVSDGERVAAVIDWDGLRTGDRRADLVKFAFTALETAPEPVLASLWEPLLASSTDGAVAAYVAHVVLNFVDWNIRFHPKLAEITITCGERAFASVDAHRFTGFRR
jgi:aminoglycoside phosphotransferase (APT) family kinase protein